MSVTDSYPESEKLSIRQIPGYSDLNKDIQEGLQRLEFLEGDEDLVKKLFVVGKLTSEFLAQADAERRILTNQEMQEVYELQNILFTNDDLQRLAVPLFGSQHLDEHGNVDPDSWFWKLVNPLGGVPHLGQANEMAGQAIAEHVEHLPADKHAKVLEAGMGGGKTALAITDALKNRRLASSVSYVGLEVAGPLVAHVEGMYQGRKPGYIRNHPNPNLRDAYHRQAQTLNELGALTVQNDSISDHLPKVNDESIDALVIGYMIHHLKSGFAFMRAVQSGRLQINGEGNYVYKTSNGREIALNANEVERSILNFTDQDQGKAATIKAKLILSNAGVELSAEDLNGLIQNNQLELLKAAFEKIKPGGLVIIADPEQGLSTFNKTVIVKDAEGLADFTSVAQMKGMLEAAGYKEVTPYLQWKVNREYYEANAAQFTGFNVVPESYDGGQNINSYIVALPLDRMEAFETQHGDNILDKYLGYYIMAKKPNPEFEEVHNETRNKLRRILGGGINIIGD